jgi:hypothetical protein
MVDARRSTPCTTVPAARRRASGSTCISSSEPCLERRGPHGSAVDRAARAHGCEDCDFFPGWESQSVIHRYGGSKLFGWFRSSTWRVTGVRIPG